MVQGVIRGRPSLHMLHVFGVCVISHYISSLTKVGWSPLGNIERYGPHAGALYMGGTGGEN